MYESLSKPLNIELAIKTRMDIVRLERAGLPKKSADFFAKTVGLTQEDLGTILSISPRQMQRMKPDDHFDSRVTGHLIVAAKVFSKAVDVFGSEEKAILWLKAPSRALGVIKPLSLLDTEEGAQIVLDELFAIEYGSIA